MENGEGQQRMRGSSASFSLQFSHFSFYCCVNNLICPWCVRRVEACQANCPVLFVPALLLMVIVIDFRRGQFPSHGCPFVGNQSLLAFFWYYLVERGGKDVCRPRQTYRETVVLRIVWSVFFFFLNIAALRQEPTPSLPLSPWRSIDHL